MLGSLSSFRTQGSFEGLVTPSTRQSTKELFPKSLQWKPYVFIIGCIPCFFVRSLDRDEDPENFELEVRAIPKRKGKDFGRGPCVHRAG
jgi:hypothetical protein